MRHDRKDQKVILISSVKSVSNTTLRAFISLFYFSEYLKENLQSV